jgi:hypothetical protein
VQKPPLYYNDLYLHYIIMTVMVRYQLINFTWGKSEAGEANGIKFSLGVLGGSKMFVI